jgi:hypothetical protein
MMKLLLIFLMLLSPQELNEQALVVESDSPPVLEVGDKVSLNIITIVPVEKSQYSVTLLPLDLEGFRLESMTSNTTTEGSVFDSPRKVSFFVTLEAAEVGNGVLNEIQVELTPPGEDSNPELFTHPGFTSQIIRPFPWHVYLPWIIGGVLLALMGIFIYFRYFASSGKDEGPRLSPAEEKRLATVKRMDELKIRGEWSKLVEVGYNAIIEENSSRESINSKVTFSQEDIENLTANWPDFPVVFRLGEEVRYGGYQPQKQEAAFLIRFVKDYFNHLNVEEKRTEEAA